MQSTKAFNAAKYLSARDREIAALKRQRAELDHLIQAVEAGRQAVAENVLTHASTPRTNGNGSRAAILREILEARTDAVDVDLILKELHQRGHDAPRGGVAASLSALKKQGAVTNPERGMWKAAVAQAA